VFEAIVINKAKGLVKLIFPITKKTWNIGIYQVN